MKRMVWALAVLMVLSGGAALRAQDPRDAMVARAFNEFDTQRRMQLLVAALNPTAGPPRGAWPVGVQLLAQTLLEDGKDSLAGTWLRWAVRLSPDLQPDTVQFLPRVAEAYRAARTYVTRTRSNTDTLAPTTWLWNGQASSETQGKFQVASSSAPLRVEIRGVGVVGPGGSVALNPGSYQIGVTAAGYDSVQVTREVLPGMTTVVDFRPVNRAAAVAAAPAAAQPQPAPAPRPATPAPATASSSKKKFPVLLVVGGAAAVGVAALLLAGGGDDEPTTGGITVTFPNPP